MTKNDIVAPIEAAIPEYNTPGNNPNKKPPMMVNGGTPGIITAITAV